MDPPSVPPFSTTTTTTIQPHHPDSSMESSPSYRIVDETWPDHHDHPFPHVPGTKLRLMCSYGDHIMPRPNDNKSLSYFGGDTRMVTVDRHSSFKDFCARLSHTLLHGRPFSLKYQLPNEDLDNLITVTTDEDLNNMIEEHDRFSSKTSPSSRLRMFLFFCKPDTAVSVGSLLDDAKSETWFVDALNNSGILQRGVSDSAAVDCLLNLDGVHACGSSNDLEPQVAEAATTVVDGIKQVKHDVHSVPGSPMVENSSSYGSSSSSSSMTNLVPIRVRVDDNGTSRVQQEQRVVMEEQFAQMTFGTSGVVKHDDGYAMSSAAAAASAPMPAIPAAVTMVTTTSDNVNRVVSDDDRLDHGVTAGYRKPPLPLQLLQPRTSGGFSLPSPHSVASDSSIASANSFSKTVYYQDQVQAAHVDNKGPALPNIKSEMSDHSPRLQREQVQDSGCTLPQQLDQNQRLQHQQQQQQFVYIRHPATTGQVPMSSYYPVYAPPSQQQLHHPIGQQHYSVYVMPVGPTQPYNMTTLQPNIADPNVAAASSRPLPSNQFQQQYVGLPQTIHHPPHPIAIAPSATANYGYVMPVGPTQPYNMTTLQPNIADPNVVAASSRPLPSNQFQQQYVGLPQTIHHPPHPIAIAPSATANYGYDYGGPTQDHVYYTQHQATAPQPPQCQSMTPAAAAAALSDVSKQFPLDNIQQPSRTSQPV